MNCECSLTPAPAKQNQAGPVGSRTLTGLILRSKKGDVWIGDYSDNLGVGKETYLVPPLLTTLFPKQMRQEVGGKMGEGNLPGEEGAGIWSSLAQRWERSREWWELSLVLNPHQAWLLGSSPSFCIQGGWLTSARTVWDPA